MCAWRALPLTLTARPRCRAARRMLAEGGGCRWLSSAGRRTARHCGRGSAGTARPHLRCPITCARGERVASPRACAFVFLVSLQRR